jgi:class 3 adenylate cyclase
LAKRVEGLAHPDRIYLTEHTAALVAGGLQLTDLGAFDVRGAEAPVRVFELA